MHDAAHGQGRELGRQECGGPTIIAARDTSRGDDQGNETTFGHVKMVRVRRPLNALPSTHAVYMYIYIDTSVSIFIYMYRYQCVFVCGLSVEIRGRQHA